jgi:hypothetical protein
MQAASLEMAVLHKQTFQEAAHHRPNRIRLLQGEPVLRISETLANLPHRAVGVPTRAASYHHCSAALNSHSATRNRTREVWCLLSISLWTIHIRPRARHALSSFLTGSQVAGLTNRTLLFCNRP